MHVCQICNYNFKKKQYLNRHLNEKRCKSPLLDDWMSLHSLLEHLRNQNQQNNNNNNNRDISMNNIEMNINSICSLELDYIQPEEMKKIVEKFDQVQYNNPSYLQILLSDYIKNMIHDKEHPENHVVKYIRRRPPTFNCRIQDEDDNVIEVLRELKEASEVLSDPILTIIKSKFKEFLKKYRHHEEFDYDLYEDTIQHMHKELNIDTIKKSISYVLRIDILNDVQMKLIIN